MNNKKLYPEPIKGIPIVDSETPQKVNDILLGYEIIEVEPEVCNFCVRPRPSRMNIGGWILFGVTLLLFWPISVVSCCLKTSYDTVQRPVYGNP